MTDSVLVIGYGNELRRDDGVGPRVARAVAALKWPGVRALAVHQLTPELAEPLASAGCAVFVDAAESGRELSTWPVRISPGRATLGHSSDPAWLLGLAEVVFGRQPPAWMVAIPVADLDHGRGLSQTAKRGVRLALEKLWQLTEQARLM